MLSAAWWYAMPQEAPGSGGAASAGTETAQTTGSASAESERLSYAEVADLVKANNSSTFSDELIICTIWTESSFRPASQNPASTATGLMQVTKGAAATVGADHAEMKDPAKNVQAGTKYLAWTAKQAGSDKKLAVELYNAGVGYKADFVSGKRPYTYAPKIIDCEACLLAKPQDPRTCLAIIHP